MAAIDLVLDAYVCYIPRDKGELYLFRLSHKPGGDTLHALAVSFSFLFVCYALFVVVVVFLAIFCISFIFVRYCNLNTDRKPQVRQLGTRKVTL